METATKTLFTIGLGLTEPWEVKDTKLVVSETDAKYKELHIWIDFNRDHLFVSSKGQLLKAHDSVEKTWRHLNFFEHPCYLHANVPRLRTTCATIEMVSVPWARSGSGFTLLFEAFALALIEETPVNSVAEVMQETAPRIWRVFSHWVGIGKDRIDLSRVSRVGVDETSSRKGHRYITQFVDLDTRKTIFVCEGKDASTFKRFLAWFEEHGGFAEQITLVSMDMSTAFLSGCMTYFPKAQIVYDKFHIIQEANKALDEVRKMERSEKKLLKGQRYTLLHLRKNLPESKLSTLDTILYTYPDLGKAYSLREGLVDALNPKTTDPGMGWDAFSKWLEQAEKSGLPPIARFVNTLKAHLFGIKAFFECGKATNSVLEGLNSKIQLAKRRARGFRNIENFINMIYFINGGNVFRFSHETL